MKKLIILLAVIAVALSAKAQTIDTAFHRYPGCKVVPFYNNPRTDTTYITHVVVVRGSFDYEQRSITVYYAFCSDNQQPIFAGTIPITGSDFVSGQVAPNKLIYFFTYLAAHLPGITYR